MKWHIRDIIAQYDLIDWLIAVLIVFLIILVAFGIMFLLSLLMPPSASYTAEVIKLWV